jgi:hypothetical protein
VATTPHLLLTMIILHQTMTPLLLRRKRFVVKHVILQPIVLQLLVGLETMLSVTQQRRFASIQIVLIILSLAAFATVTIYLESVEIHVETINIHCAMVAKVSNADSSLD